MMYKKYYKILFALITCLVFSNYSFGQEENALLWKISGKGIKKTSYLYGTFHVVDERVQFMMDTIVLLMDDCKYMAGEINHKEEMGDPFSLLKFMKMEDQTLEGLYSEEDYKYVDRRLDEELGPISFFAKDLKPFYIYTLIAVEIVETDTTGFSDFTEVLDDLIQTSAREKGLEIFGLETAEEALSVIDNITLEEQARILINHLENLEDLDYSVEDLMDEMIEMYLSQDLGKMVEVYEQDSLGDQFENHLIVHRNKYFTERLIKLMQKKPTFCAVGALHLPGEEGMVQLLRAEGYSVEPIFYNGGMGN